MIPKQSLQPFSSQLIILLGQFIYLEHLQHSRLHLPDGILQIIAIAGGKTGFIVKPNTIGVLKMIHIVGEIHKTIKFFCY